jgi:hypothetical protein
LCFLIGSIKLSSISMASRKVLPESRGFLLGSPRTPDSRLFLLTGSASWSAPPGFSCRLSGHNPWYMPTAPLWMNNSSCSYHWTWAMMAWATCCAPWPEWSTGRKRQLPPHKNGTKAFFRVVRYIVVFILHL